MKNLKLNPMNITSIEVKGKNWQVAIFKHYFYKLRKIFKEPIFFFALMDTFCHTLDVEVSFVYNDNGKEVKGQFHKRNLMAEVVAAFIFSDDNYFKIYATIKDRVEKFEEQSIILIPLMKIQYLQYEE